MPGSHGKKDGAWPAPETLASGEPPADGLPSLSKPRLTPRQIHARVVQALLQEQRARQLVPGFAAARGPLPGRRARARGRGPDRELPRPDSATHGLHGSAPVLAAPIVGSEEGEHPAQRRTQGRGNRHLGPVDGGCPMLDDSGQARVVGGSGREIVAHRGRHGKTAGEPGGALGAGESVAGGRCRTGWTPA